VLSRLATTINYIRRGYEVPIQYEPIGYLFRTEALGLEGTRLTAVPR
jgi:hypothetical protein